MMVKLLNNIPIILNINIKLQFFDHFFLKNIRLNALVIYITFLEYFSCPDFLKPSFIVALEKSVTTGYKVEFDILVFSKIYQISISFIYFETSQVDDSP